VPASDPGPDAVFDQLAREPRLSDKVSQLIRDRILSGRLSPGDRLPSERELGEMFGVSRTVIREAVRALAAKGLIEVRSGSGLRVAPADASNVQESMTLFLRAATLDYEKLHEVRKVLEVHIAGLAADRATPEDGERLRDAARRMEQTASDGKDIDLDAVAQRDLDFHAAVAAATHNELFMLLMDPIGEALISVRRANLRVNLEQTLDLHRDVVERIAAGDVAGARAAMARHLDHVEETWRALQDEPDTAA
jgi:GntR family transcriptional repressor for pyruvate dehydrogenase complex